LYLLRTVTVSRIRALSGVVPRVGFNGSQAINVSTQGQYPKAHGPYESVPCKVSTPICELCRSVPQIDNPAHAGLD